MVGGFGFYVGTQSKLKGSSLKHYISEVMEFLNNSEEDLFFGGWFNEETNFFEFEISINYQSKAQSKLKGYKLKQFAIWDVDNKKDIIL